MWPLLWLRGSCVLMYVSKYSICREQMAAGLRPLIWDQTMGYLSAAVINLTGLPKVRLQISNSV